MVHFTGLNPGQVESWKIPAWVANQNLAGTGGLTFHVLTGYHAKGAVGKRYILAIPLRYCIFVLCFWFTFSRILKK